jgi:hypothetical protein
MRRNDELLLSTATLFETAYCRAASAEVEVAVVLYRITPEASL